MKRIALAIGVLVSCLCTTVHAQHQSAALSTQNSELRTQNSAPLPVHPVPSERQLRWHETEFYAFFHYGMNTYTGREWGYGNEAESTFAPTAAPNPRQWLKVAKEAGMRGGIAVAKHHDGFCLWPTESTTHSVLGAGNKHGRRTNIPRDFARAARRLGMKYGFYVSPWDRNSALYGTDAYVTEVFLRQCAELAQYGSDQFEMWLDGANGGDGYYGGREGTVKVDTDIYYDIPNLRDTIHKFLPNCVMWGMGGEARWIGNEAGYAAETNWAMMDVVREDPALLIGGMREGYVWQGGESDAMATDKGWFWHEGEGVKSSERLFQMYLETVGRNATLILNLPPGPDGLLPQATADTLRQLGRLLETRLGKRSNIAPKATATASITRSPGRTQQYDAAQAIDSKKDTYWATPDDARQATLTLSWPAERELRYIILQEPIALGQRVARFAIETSTDGQEWTPQGTQHAQTTIGYKRIIPLTGTTADSYGTPIRARHLRLRILESRACPLISNIEVH